MTDNPKVSVIMGIYNCEQTLPQAIDSIVEQTYTNWELIMCDDGSTDNTCAVAKQYADQYPQKIILLRNEKNMKLSYTLNRCLSVASGELIARMDGDDISHPERIARQVNLLLANPDIQLVGTAMRQFDEYGKHGIMHPSTNPDSSILKNSIPFFHATIMTYKAVYDALGGYCEKKRAERVEDVDLWFRFYSKGFKGTNLDEPLYEVREDFSAVKRRTLQARIHSIQTRVSGYKLLGFPMRSLLFPASILFIKGLIPHRIAAFLQKKRALWKER